MQYTKRGFIVKNFVLNFDKNTCFVCAWKWFFFFSSTVLEASWNVMAHAQKKIFRLSAKRTSPFNSAGFVISVDYWQPRCALSGSNVGYTMFRGSVKSTGYPIHSPASPSFPLPCITVCYHISTGLYIQTGFIKFIWLSNHQCCHIIFILRCMFEVPSRLYPWIHHKESYYGCIKMLLLSTQWHNVLLIII